MMEARSGRNALVTAFSTCLFTSTLTVVIGCGSVQSGTDGPAAYHAMPNADSIPDALSHRFFSMYEGQDIDIGLPPE